MDAVSHRAVITDVRKVRRRDFLLAALSIGASAALASSRVRPSRLRWSERRDLYPEGVASGDPISDGVILWTRRPFAEPRVSANLKVEVAEDREFRRVVAESRASIFASEDWTCRVMVTGLRAATEYWYRFADEHGFGSRIGRTLTAPAESDDRDVRFAFISCQNANCGAQNAYRRMIFEDERAGESRRLDFVLHLGDFIYELVWYPADRPQGMYDRELRDIVRYENGEKIEDFHIPTTLDDYRAIYRAYLHDPDIQDARARWPFVNMWDNHEFSWLGWQSFQKFQGTTRSAQTRKVAANQAWFEYQPARIRKPRSQSLDHFDPPRVVNAAVERFDDHGMGQEPNNLAALASLTGYRSLRWGRHVDLIVTDQRSYRSQDPVDRPEARAFVSADFPELVPQEVVEILDAGRAYDSGHPPDSIRYGEREVANFRRSDPPQTILGAVQKQWFLERLRASRATWKIWGNTVGTLDYRADPQNLPAGLSKPWPGSGYASIAGSDFGNAFVERGEIYDFISDHAITGFVTVAGDRHAFWAGLAAKSLPPSLSSLLASPSLPARSPPRHLRKASSTICRKIIRCGRCTCWMVPQARSPSPRSICSCSTACARASNISAPETSRRRARAEIPICLRTCPSWIWADTAIASCMRPATGSRSSSCASRDQLNAVPHRTGDRCAIASRTVRSAGGKGSSLACSNASSRVARSFPSRD